ncbi:MAG: PAS domain S-box protein [Halioglobus sp.]|nr:PAS domain S-box protein [Halioglobus sp.]
MNEELNTVNSELQAKVAELEVRHDDIDNLLASTDIATLFLDRNLCIKLFNPPLAALMNLRAGDVDRPYSDFSGRVQGDEFEVDAQQVLEKLIPVERVVKTTCEAHSAVQPQSFLRRMVPYRAGRDHIDGVVITFVDISECYRQQERLQEAARAHTKELNRSRRQLSLVLQAAGAAVWEMDRTHSRTLVVVETHRDLFGQLPSDTDDAWKWWLEHIDPQQRSTVLSSLQRALDGGGDHWQADYRFRTANGDYRWVSDSAHISRSATGQWRRANGAMIDIHERRQMELAALERGERLAAIMDNTADAILVFDYSGAITDCNPAAGAMLGYTVAELLGKSVLELMPAHRRETYRKALRGKRPLRAFIQGVADSQPSGLRKDGSTFPASVKVSSIDSRGLLVLVAHDLSKQRALQQEMNEVSSWEKENIGRELHDSLGQRLAGLYLLATQLRSGVVRGDSADKSVLEDIIAQLKTAAREVSQISRGLAPITVSPGGLKQALATLVETVQKTSEATCRCQTQADADVTDPSMAHQLYRIAQEALTNLKFFS